MEVAAPAEADPARWPPASFPGSGAWRRGCGSWCSLTRFGHGGSLLGADAAEGAERWLGKVVGREGVMDGSRDRSRDVGVVGAIGRLREYRKVDGVDRSLAAAARAERERLETEARRLGSAGRAWAEAEGLGLDPALAAKTHASRVWRGTLIVEASDASARYRVARWLRGGGERAVLRLAGGGVRGVKVVVGGGEGGRR